MTINQESYTVRRGGGLVKKALATSVLAAVLAVPILMSPASAADDVRAGRTIEAFIGTNLVDVQGYPANKPITISVLRNGVVVSSVSGKTDAAGFAEFNHVGGGQVSRGGDCFKPPVSPDIMPGDTIRTRIAGDPAGRFDSAVVRDVEVDFGAITTDTALNTISISGTVNSFADGVVVPGTDVLELRLNANGFTWDANNGRRDLREDVGADVQPDGSFTHTFNVSAADAQNWADSSGEVALEWSAGAGAGEEALPPAIFVSDEAGGEAILGCPPFAENAVTSSSPQLVNKANVGKGLRLAGISNGATGPVTVTLDDRNAATDAIDLTATPQDAYVTGSQSWRTAPMTPQQILQLRALSNGNLTASASVGGPNLRITKDTVAPRTPTATPRPGVYPRPQRVTLDAQPGTTIRYTLNGSRPTKASPVFNRSIRIASTKRIKAIAIDKAGNTSPLGSFRYVIRR